MRRYYIDNKYEDIMNLTWFCHTPIDGKPCGKCNPCRYTIEEGLRERFTRIALMRYYLQKIKDILYKIYKRMKEYIACLSRIKK